MDKSIEDVLAEWAGCDPEDVEVGDYGESWHVEEDGDEPGVSVTDRGHYYEVEMTHGPLTITTEASDVRDIERWLDVIDRMMKAANNAMEEG